MKAAIAIALGAGAVAWLTGLPLELAAATAFVGAGVTIATEPRRSARQTSRARINWRNEG